MYQDGWRKLITSGTFYEAINWYYYLFLLSYNKVTIEALVLIMTSYLLQVNVKTLEKGFLINVYSEKSSQGLLVSVLETFEELGLNAIEARVSCTDTFHLEAVGEVRETIYHQSLMNLFYTRKITYWLTRLYKTYSSCKVRQLNIWPYKKYFYFNSKTSMVLWQSCEQKASCIPCKDANVIFTDL